MAFVRLVSWCFLTLSVLASGSQADSGSTTTTTQVNRNLRSSSSSFAGKEQRGEKQKERNIHRSLNLVDSSGFAWTPVNESTNYTQRHENAFIQAGDRFYVMGGRELSETVDIYNYANDTWSSGAEFDSIIHHFQAVTYQGLIWVVAGLINSDFPAETPASRVFLFDPANNAWLKGPTIPQDRRRGGGGLVMYQDKFYFVCGNKNGHDGMYVNLFDEYDPYISSFTVMPSAPHPRDHFQAAMINDVLYAAGGRLSGGPGGTFAPLVPEVDAYDFTTGTWTTLATNLPTPRAGTMAVNFHDHLLIIGGEGTAFAFRTTEAYDPVSQTWSSRADMNFRRHATQAFVSGDGVITTGGSNNKGGGRQHNMEVYGTYNPTGQTLTPGVLFSPSVGSGPLLVLPLLPVDIVVQHVAGNSGVFVEKMEFTGSFANHFSVQSDVLQNQFLIGIGTTRTFSISYLGAIGNSAAAPHAFFRLSYGGGHELLVPLRAVNSNSGTLPPTPSPIAAPDPESLVVAIDVGSNLNDEPSYIMGNTGVAESTLPIFGTAPNLERFQTHRWGKFNTFTYSIPGLTPSTPYRVDLGFAETNLANCLTGKRIFHVAFQGTRVLSNFDVYATAGCQTALVRTFEVVSDGSGKIFVAFQKGPVELPYVSSIDVYEVPSAPVSPPTLQPVPVAQPSEVSILFIDVGSDNHDQPTFLSGNTGRSVKLSKTIAGTEDQVPFRTHRWGKFGNFAYNIRNLVPNVTYRLELGFAETNNANCHVGNRIFDVVVQGSVVVPALDVFDRVGCDTALVLSFPVAVGESGILSVEMRKGPVELPYLSSFELFAPTSPNPTFVPTLPPVDTPLTSSPTRAPTSSPTNAPTGVPTSPPTTTPTNSPIKVITTPVYTRVVYIDIASNSDDQVSYLSGNTGKNIKNSRAIAGTANPVPFRSHRWGRNGYFAYTVPNLTPSTLYRVNLGFAETNFGNCAVGKRQFHVSLQSVRVLDNLDVFAEAGCNTALVKTFDVNTDASGVMLVEYEKGNIELPFASLLEIFSITQSTLPPTASPVVGAPVRVLYIDAGSQTGGDRPDLISAGSPRSTSKGNQIKGPNGTTLPEAEQIPFRSHRWGYGGDFAYTIPNLVPEAAHRVVMGFAELTGGNCSDGKRLFHIDIQNLRVLQNFDVYKESGGCRTSLVKTFDTTADAAGNIKVEFIKGPIELPFVSSIEILRLGSTSQG